MCPQFCTLFLVRVTIQRSGSPSFLAPQISPSASYATLCQWVKQKGVCFLHLWLRSAERGRSISSPKRGREKLSRTVVELPESVELSVQISFRHFVFLVISRFLENNHFLLAASLPVALACSFGGQTWRWRRLGQRSDLLWVAVSSKSIMKARLSWFFFLVSAGVDGSHIVVDLNSWQRIGISCQWCGILQIAFNKRTLDWHDQLFMDIQNCLRRVYKIPETFQMHLARQFSRPWCLRSW